MKVKREVEVTHKEFIDSVEKDLRNRLDKLGRRVGLHDWGADEDLRSPLPEGASRFYAEDFE